MGKLKRSKASTTENDVALALFQFEHPVTGKTGLLIFYPLRFVMLVRKIQKTLTSELEKRFAGCQVFLVAQRKITKRPNDVYKLQEVQRSRTATAVNENILNDLIHPADMVGRRWRFRTDGSRVMKIYLDARMKAKIGSRLQNASYLYKKLTHRVVSFGFMWNPRLQQIAQK